MCAALGVAKLLPFHLPPPPRFVQTHVTHNPVFRHLAQIPYTTPLMLMGMGIGALHSAERMDCSEADDTDNFAAMKAAGTFGTHHYRSGYGYLGDSIQMWLEIDSHLLLFCFLPALLFGDAFGLNWYTVKQCLAQCLVLAILGVLMGTALTALYAKYVLPYDWDWDACFMFGSILSATDPVAVVGLLKEVRKRTEKRGERGNRRRGDPPPYLPSQVVFVSLYSCAHIHGVSKLYVPL